MTTFGICTAVVTTTTAAILSTTADNVFFICMRTTTDFCMTGVQRSRDFCVTKVVCRRRGGRRGRGIGRRRGG